MRLRDSIAIRPARLAALLATMLFIPVWLATPATAVVGECGTGELGFVSSSEGCRSTAIIDPNGQLLTRADLLRNLELYEHWGFSEAFIREAPQQTLTVTSDTRWTGCDDNRPWGGLCPVNSTSVGGSSMTNLFPVGMEFTVIGTPEKWIALMCGNFSPIEEEPYDADVAKTGFDVVNAPERMDADVDTQLTIRATVVSSGGYSPVSATDVITVEAPPDCTVTPARIEKPLLLIAGQPQTFDGSVTVRCTDPSNHTFTFTDELIGQTGVYDQDLTNNHATTTVTIEVFDDSDLAVSDTQLDCTDEAMVGAAFECTGRTQVRNLGPYGPTESDLSLELNGPGDCEITPGTGENLTGAPIGVNGSVTVDRSWNVTCTNRSYHEMSLTAAAAVTHVHVEDHNTMNDTATASDVVEVFEEVDLESTVIDLRCSEREANQTSSACEATVAVTNNGPATAVLTETDVSFLAGPTCTADPTGAQTTPVTLDAGQTATITALTSISCSTEERHAVTVEAVLHNAPSDPHAVDSDTATARWVPSDTKPRSLPSSINIDKQGALPFAVLATADLNPLTDLDLSTLRYGVTGAEDSVQRCASGGEDVNDDGRPDLVCQADTQATGVTLETTEMIVTGLLHDGTPFFSQDDVNVVGR